MSATIAPNSSQVIGLLVNLDRSWLNATVVLVILFIFSGLFLNALCFIGIIRTSNRLNSDTLLILGLCLVDFTLCLFVLPSEAIRFLEGEWTFGEGFLCQFVAFYHYLAKGLSMSIILLMSINRLIIVMSSKPRCEGIGRTKLLISGTFSVALVTTFLLLQATKVYGRFGYHEQGQTCTIMPHNGISPKIVVVTVGILLPMISVIVCYAVVIGKVLKSGRNLNRSSQCSRKMTKQQQVIRLGVSIFSIFLFTNMLSLIVNLADPEYSHQVLHLMCYWCIYSASCLNPLVFVMLSSKYREAVVRLLTDIRSKITSQRPPMCDATNTEN